MGRTWFSDRDWHLDFWQTEYKGGCRGEGVIRELGASRVTGASTSFSGAGQITRMMRRSMINSLTLHKIHPPRFNKLETRWNSRDNGSHAYLSSRFIACWSNQVAVNADLDLCLFHGTLDLYKASSLDLILSLSLWSTACVSIKRLSVSGAERQLRVRTEEEEEDSDCRDWGGSVARSCWSFPASPAKKFGQFLKKCGPFYSLFKATFRA